MAIIESRHIKVEILPINKVRDWIGTEVSIQFDILPTQPVKFTVPSENLHFHVNDTEQLVNGIKSYISNMPISSKDNIFAFNDKVFNFTPMGIGFDFSLSQGEYQDESKQDGWVTLDFKLSLRGFKESKTNNSIGCELRVTLATINQFVQDIDTDFKNLQVV